MVKYWSNGKILYVLTNMFRTKVAAPMYRTKSMCVAPIVFKISVWFHFFDSKFGSLTLGIVTKYAQWNFILKKSCKIAHSWINNNKWSFFFVSYCAIKMQCQCKVTKYSPWLNESQVDKCDCQEIVIKWRMCLRGMNYSRDSLRPWFGNKKYLLLFHLWW